MPPSCDLLLSRRFIFSIGVSVCRGVCFTSKPQYVAPTLDEACALGGSQILMCTSTGRSACCLRYEDGVSEADWKDRDFLGPKQWARLEQAFSTDFADCDTVLFGAPTPLVFISQA